VFSGTTEKLPQCVDIMVREESYVIGKERCPKCAKLGNDTSADNLAVYSDGHKYCYGCGYHSRGTTRPFSSQETRGTASPVCDSFYMPDDISPDIAFKPMMWLKDQCHFTIQDIISNKILWSQMYKWLIFPIEHEGMTLGFQARNFNEIKPYKWYTKFRKKDLLKIYTSNETTHSLVLVEDIVSAIRVGNIVPCAPIFGSTIADSLLMKIKKYPITELVIWLDEDKWKQSLVYAQRARELGINVKCISTTIDPKGHTNQQLRKILK
jgi:hypothetical protein